MNIFRAIEKNDVDFIESCAVNGKESMLNGRTPGNLTPLMYASALGKDDCVKALIKAKVDLDEQGGRAWTGESSGNTALHLACENKHATTAKILIDAGANMQLCNFLYGDTPLHYAAKHGLVDTVKEMIGRNIDPDLYDKGGNTPLMSVCRSRYSDDFLAIAETLFAAGADLNMECKDPKIDVSGHLFSKPLHEAATMGNAKLVEFMIENNADVHIKDCRGATPLLTACQISQVDIEEVVRLLLKANADPNTKDAHKAFALNEACRNGRTKVAKILIDAQADVRAEDHYHKTPFDYACANGNLKLAQYLIDAGADVKTVLPHLRNKSFVTKNKKEILMMVYDHLPESEKHNLIEKSYKKELGHKEYLS